jgi:hypothetical protein
MIEETAFVGEVNASPAEPLDTHLPWHKMIK